MKITDSVPSQRYKKVIKPLAETASSNTKTMTPKTSTPAKKSKSPRGNKRAAEGFTSGEEGGVTQKGMGKGAKKFKVETVEEEAFAEEESAEEV